MAVSTTNPFENGAWSIEGGKPIETGDEKIPFEAQPYLKGKAWENYCDPVTYQADKAFREWVVQLEGNSLWRRDKNKRIYMYSELFRLIFGRPYNPKDASTARKISKIFAYYSTSVSKSAWNRDKKKWVTKTCYVISSNSSKRPAYSLRLRIEELARNGEVPNRYNMKLPKDDLKPGHARNPRTEANKQARAERGRLAYNEYQRKRRRIRAEQAAGEELGNA